MIKTTLKNNLTTQSEMNNKKPLQTAFLDPRQDVNPGEMLAASLGACMMTMVGYMASKKGDDAQGTYVEIYPQFDDKHSRIVSFDITFVFPAAFTQAQKETYARAAQTCPVHNSLREDINYTVTVK